MTEKSAVVSVMLACEDGSINCGKWITSGTFVMQLEYCIIAVWPGIIV